MKSWGLIAVGGVVAYLALKASGIALFVQNLRGHNDRSNDQTFRIGYGIAQKSVLQASLCAKERSGKWFHPTRVGSAKIKL